ncbi:uncharacterized protein LOC126484922 [Schistocerca serialis cubense]|uniref:uncharacterized protein LOC126484922 n=1 Tax=Schistocerca serialis cubense TaxID=2023355 RepID=UPI00214F10A0|nr:uncharacterized protein LOC126484922 [Schistocerca serialis cubense]
MPCNSGGRAVSTTGSAATVLGTISSHEKRRIQELVEDFEAQLTTNIKDSVAFSSSLEDSPDLSDRAWLVTFIRTVNKMLEVCEEMLGLIPLKNTTKGQGKFHPLEAVTEKYGLPRILLTHVATNGAPAMTGETSMECPEKNEES